MCLAGSGGSTSACKMQRPMVWHSMGQILCNTVKTQGPRRVFPPVNKSLLMLWRLSEEKVFFIINVTWNIEHMSLTVQHNSITITHYLFDKVQTHLGSFFVRQKTMQWTIGGYLFLFAYIYCWLWLNLACHCVKDYCTIILFYTAVSVHFYSCKTFINNSRIPSP